MRTLRRFLLAFLLPLAVAAAVFFVPAASRRRREQERPARPTAGQDIDRSGRTAAENRAIAAALAALEKEKGFVPLRTAEDEDASPSEDRSDLQDLYGTYHPYFVRGDLDGDGRPDFAQAFLESGPAGWFHIAVFFGRPDGGYEPPVWVEHAISLAAGDISVDRTLLIVMPDLAFDEARRWRWDATERRFVDAEAGAAARGEDDEVAPDEKPRVRI